MNRFTDLASEKGLVGSLIVNPYNFIEIADLVTFEMFTSDLCREVLKQLHYFHDQNIEADNVLIYDAMIAKGLPYRFEDVADLVHFINSENIRQYAVNIKEAYFSRTITENLSEGLNLIAGGAQVMEVVNRFDSQKEKLIEGLQTEEDAHVSGFIKDSLDIIHLAKDNKGLTGIDTGSEKLNGHFGGWSQGRTITIAGRPGMGKTSIFLSWALSAANTGTSVLIFSLEVSREMMILTLAANISGIQTDLMLQGKLTDEQMDKVVNAHSELSELPIYILDNVYHIDEIVNKTRLYAKKFNVKLTGLDYIQLAKGSREKGGNRHQEIESIMQGLKRLTKSTDAYQCVIILSQLNRAVETRGGTKRPQLSDLKESGSIEEGSDIVGMMYRAEYYGIMEDEEGNNLKGITELIIAKNKWGSVGTIKQKMIGRRFVDLEDEETVEYQIVPELESINNSPIYRQEVEKKINQGEQLLLESDNAMRDARPSLNDEDIPF